MGRFSGASEEQLSERLANIAEASLGVYRKGHTPLVGVHQAYSMLDLIDGTEEQVGMVAGVCLGLAAHCDAILHIGRSSGVDQEIAEFTGRGRPVYASLDEVPDTTEGAAAR
ncbi:hypothetical protein OHR86_33060 [Streptomyces sp. NBC_00441]|uniref:hypothetical protein n=1 Tax=Streptomyces sp. NBC_00441 TaxID=2975742 RepID=UPI002E2A7D86|nr:hypothetical protein [Streptomyces sp. NBC_00441]